LVVVSEYVTLTKGEGQECEGERGERYDNQGYGAKAAKLCCFSDPSLLVTNLEAVPRPANTLTVWFPYRSRRGRTPTTWMSGVCSLLDVMFRAALVSLISFITKTLTLREIQVARRRRVQVGSLIRDGHLCADSTSAHRSKIGRSRD
jgi:hypothetical protein